MVDRVSALTGHYQPGQFGIPGNGDSPGVILEEVPGLVLQQIAAWPDTLEEVGKLAADAIGSKSVAPGPCRALSLKKGSLLRVEPLKWWVYGASTDQITPEKGATLDLSHSRTQVRISGPAAVALLNRHLPLDLRESAFPIDSVASSVIHHVGVTLWRSRQGYELFIPRGFALSLWEGLVDTAAQFGGEVI